MIGREIAASYRVGERRGRVGGELYVATHCALGRQVLLLVRDAAPATKARARFVADTCAVASLGHHPNIAEVSDLGESGEALYVMLELRDGETLGEYLAREGRMAPERVAAVGVQLSDALATAHEHGLVHGGLHADRVWLSASHRSSSAGLVAKVFGFGVERWLGGYSASRRPPADHRGDVHALGTLLYEMLAGTPPRAATAVAPGEPDLQSPGQALCPGIPPALSEAVARALSTPERRFQSMRALRRELAAASASAAGGARRAG